MAKKTTKRNGVPYTAPIYKSYVFREKEPVIDMQRTLFEDVYGERVNGKMLAEISKQGGPSVSCMRNWFFGKTRRPTNAAIEASGRALGYERIWKKMKA
jgi:hypothetical protein